MATQQNVRTDLAWGVAGEIALQGVCDAFPGYLAAEGKATNGGLFGRALTYTGKNTGEVQFGGNGVFAGILANPKESAQLTCVGQTNTVIPAGSYVSVVTKCAGIWVNISTAANVGDGVAYSTTAGGTLSAAPKGVAPSGTVLIPGASVVRFDATAGLAIISL